MNEPVLLVTPRDGCVSDSNQTLDDAKAENFESVLVIGFKDNKVKFKASRSLDVTKLLGAIEVAKYEYLSGWK